MIESEVERNKRCLKELMYPKNICMKIDSSGCSHVYTCANMEESI